MLQQLATVTIEIPHSSVSQLGHPIHVQSLTKNHPSPPPPPTSMFIDLISFLHPATEQVNGSDAGSID